MSGGTPGLEAASARQELGAAVRIGRAAEDMQPVPDLQILHVAEIGVEARELVVLAHVGLRAPLSPSRPSAVGAGQDFAAQQRGAAAVEPVGGGKFVDQPLELGASAPRPAGFKGGVRWPMVTAPSRRLAAAASPGLLTMKG